MQTKQTCSSCCVWGPLLLRGSLLQGCMQCGCAAARGARGTGWLALRASTRRKSGRSQPVDGANKAFATSPLRVCFSCNQIFKQPTVFGHIPDADRSIVMKKQVTSLRSCLETLRQLCSLDSDCTSSSVRPANPSLCWLGCKAVTDSKWEE